MSDKNFPKVVASCKRTLALGAVKNAWIDFDKCDNMTLKYAICACIDVAYELSGMTICDDFLVYLDSDRGYFINDSACIKLSIRWLYNISFLY